MTFLFLLLLIGQSFKVLASDWLNTRRQGVTLSKVTLPVIASLPPLSEPMRGEDGGAGTNERSVLKSRDLC